MHVIGKEYLDEPALVYLEEGTNIIRLEIVLGPLAALLQRTEDLLYELNTIYRRIIMITTSNPDPFRSYELHRRIPGLIERLREIAESSKKWSKISSSSLNNVVVIQMC